MADKSWFQCKTHYQKMADNGSEKRVSETYLVDALLWGEAETRITKELQPFVKAGEELFIILDEILKGTNSMDKQKGSFALIKQFMHMNANGIIATHDLLLGTLIESFPQNIRNYCFEADITNNELTFSYQMRNGVAQNMNACFLMKKMGIAVIND